MTVLKKIILYVCLPFRLLIIALNMLILGLIHLFLVLVLGYERGTLFALPWIWGRIFCFACGLRLHIKGKENIPPKGKGAIFIFNHASFLDIPVIFASQRAVFNFAAKEYTLKYPVLGSVMKAVKTIIIYKDLSRSIEEYKKAEERLRNGDRFMIAPEGTRGEEETIAPFKSGPFIFAMSAHADIVPVVIYGTPKLWPKKDSLPNLSAFWADVNLEYLPAVSTKSFSHENRKEKAEALRQKMLSVFNAYKSAASMTSAQK